MSAPVPANGAPRACLITGAASGIGKALGLALAARGDRVLLADVNLEALEVVHASLAPEARERTLVRRLDVRDPAAWRGAVQALERSAGAVDVVFNIAGWLRPGQFMALSPEEIDRHIDINTKGLMHGSRAAAEVMIPRKRGHIVNMGSLAALAAVPGLALYSASKFAVRAFSLALSEELAPSGVYVTVVCPDAVQTPMLDAQVGSRDAALTFSGPRALTTDEVVAAILGPVLEKRPREILLPRSRGWLAKLAGVAPGLASAIRPMLERKGAAAQEAMRRKQGGGQA